MKVRGREMAFIKVIYEGTRKEIAFIKVIYEGMS